ncbi:hypothetical protein ASZ90_011709 [hydrocarbon metagenome]|uniref:Conserved domain protein n=2 Tax=root TaxID=1 RepID=F4BYB4_METSG|nr:conserved domain protein [Methanothrix soehngenii GP6]
MSLRGPKRKDLMPDPLYPYAAGKITGEYYARVSLGSMD